MRDQCRCTDRPRACNLHRISQLESKLIPKPCCSFSDFHIEIHHMPGTEVLR